MAAFNKVILLGNLTRDPEVRYTTGGTAVCDITLAINHTYTDKRSNERREDVSFIDVTLWGRTAEIAGEYLAKGRPVLVEGRLQQDKWDDKETGQKRSKLKVVADSMQLLGGRGDAAGGQGPGPGGPSRSTAARPSAVGEGYASAEPSRGPDQTFYDDMPAGTDDVPF